MNEAFLTGLATLIGAAMGAYGSIMGSKLAAEETIKAQLEIFKSERVRQQERELYAQKISAHIIYADLFNAIKEAILLYKRTQLENVGLASNGVVLSPDFSIHLSKIGDKLTFDELMAIKDLQGHTQRLQNATTMAQLKDFDQMRILSMHLIGTVFGKHYKNKMQTEDPRVLNEDLLINKMEHTYQQLFKKLKVIMTEN